jgi:hypothetical protein
MTFKDGVEVALLVIAFIGGAGSASDSAPVQSADSRSRYFGQTPP